jgi:hypothetical protein
MKEREGKERDDKILTCNTYEIARHIYESFPGLAYAIE